jgi:hypothetical protein
MTGRRWLQQMFRKSLYQGLMTAGVVVSGSHPYISFLVRSHWRVEASLPDSRARVLTEQGEEVHTYLM